MKELIGPFSQIITMVNLPERGVISDNSLEIIDDGGVVIEDGKIIEVGDFLSLSKNNLDVRENYTETINNNKTSNTTGIVRHTGGEIHLN